MSEVPGTFLTLRAYGRLRKERGLPGTSHTAVRKAIDSGRLVACLHETPKGIRVDPEVADEEWSRNSDAGKTNEPAGGRPARATLFEEDDLPAAAAGLPSTGAAAGGASAATMRNARTVLELYRAKLMRLDFETKEGRLIDADSVRSEAFRIARLVRENLLRIPNRVSSELATLTDPREIMGLLESEITAALEALE